MLTRSNRTSFTVDWNPENVKYVRSKSKLGDRPLIHVLDCNGVVVYVASGLRYVFEWVETRGKSKQGPFIAKFIRMRRFQFCSEPSDLEAEQRGGLKDERDAIMNKCQRHVR